MLYLSKLSKTLGHQYNLKELEDNGEQYCKETNQDYRIYSLGILFAKNVDNTQKYSERFFKCFIDIEDYTNIWSEYAQYILQDQLQYCKNDKEITNSINDIISLLEQYGDDIPEDKVYSAANLTSRSAAESVAKLAARSIWSAEWSAFLAEKSVELAARSAKFEKLANKFIEIMEKKSVL